MAEKTLPLYSSQESESENEVDNLLRVRQTNRKRTWDFDEVKFN